jgi:hypothetical protein
MSGNYGADPQSELVLGLVGACGTDLSSFADLAKDHLRQFDYQGNIIRLSAFLDDSELDLPGKLGFTVDSGDEMKRISSLMDAGNTVRQKTGRADFLARLAMAKINQKRGSASGDKTKLRGQAHILNSLKSPAEVTLLRDIYGPGFFLIAVYCRREHRLKFLHRKGVQEADAETLMERDENESHPYGQKTRDTFQMAVFL